MTTRKMVAAAVLATSLSLPMATEALRGDSGRADAQWGYALGMKGREALAFGVAGAVMCGFIPNPGGVACGIAGVL